MEVVTDQTDQTSLGREYAEALRDYASGAGEAALMRAYELGRRAAAAGVGILELALVHHEALLRLADVESQATDQPPVAMAAQFFAESLSPFEMTLRSYQANARLLGLGGPVEQNPEMERAREQLRTILDATTALIYLKDGDGRYQFVNRQFQELFAVPREQVVGKLDGEVLPPAVAEMLRGDDRAVLEARAPRQMEELLPSEDGAHTWLSLKFPLLDATGVPYGLSCVATDITERKRAEEALQRAKEAAERERQLKHAVEVRDRFLGIASHELKTPLTSLELQVQSLRRLARSHPEVAVSDERVREKCEGIVRQAERLTVLINDLLDVGRIASGRLGLAPEPLDLGELVRQVLAAAEETIRRSRAQVSLKVAAAVVGNWDRSRIETVVGNLLSNALKFGGQEPIDLVVDRFGDRALLTVRDRGLGIAAEDQPRIFDRFERAVSEQNFGGFGVGLWVARQIVEAHGGAIGVQSAPGAGSIFRVELPLGAARGGDP
jgi:PAS domain S-box-containing protein